MTWRDPRWFGGWLNIIYNQHRFKQILSIHDISWMFIIAYRFQIMLSWDGSCTPCYNCTCRWWRQTSTGVGPSGAWRWNCTGIKWVRGGQLGYWWISSSVLGHVSSLNVNGVMLKQPWKMAMFWIIGVSCSVQERFCWPSCWILNLVYRSVWWIPNKGDTSINNCM